MSVSEESKLLGLRKVIMENLECSLDETIEEFRESVSDGVFRYQDGMTNDEALRELIAMGETIEKYNRDLTRELERYRKILKVIEMDAKIS